MLVALGGAYYFLIYRPAHQVPVEAGYVLPPTVPVVDTPAEVRIVEGSVRSGDRVEILRRTHNWAEIRTGELTGWVENKDLVDRQTYESGQALLHELVKLPVQAEGHASGIVNLRLEPGRDAAQLAQLPLNEKLQVYGRRFLDRPTPADQPSAAKVRDAWYLVRAGDRAGWLLGHFVSLDPPAALSSYAQGANLVAWMVIKTVNDNGQSVPEYLTAERIGTQEADFTHIRVFTWWAKHHEYVTAYAESGLTGFFPIRVTEANGIPYFRLRIKDDQGEECQKVYGLFDTITRTVGTVPGWESNAMPDASEKPHLRRAKRRRA